MRRGTTLTRRSFFVDARALNRAKRRLGSPRTPKSSERP